MAESYTAEQESEVIRLYEVDGLSRAKIVDATGMREWRVRELIQGRTKGSRKPTINPVRARRRDTPHFSKAVEAVYALAIRPEGVREHEFRTALHNIYGSTRDVGKGNYKSNVTKNTRYKVKDRVQELSKQRNERALFVIDWVDLDAATESRTFLEALAGSITDLLYEGINDFMTAHAVTPVAEHDGDDHANQKQYRAAFDHVVKLVVRNGKEPVATLLERTKTNTDFIDGLSDLPVPKAAYPKSKGYYPEPTNNSVWLEAISSDEILSIPAQPAPAWNVPY